MTEHRSQDRTQGHDRTQELYQNTGVKTEHRVVIEHRTYIKTQESRQNTEIIAE